MKQILATLCCVALCSAPALAAKKPAQHAAMSDQQFVDFALQTDMVEANLGQLAQTSASEQAVKDYAQMLVTDHTADYHQLGNIAHQAGLSVAGSIDEEHNKGVIGPFQKLKGAAFDHRYIAEVIAGHAKAIEIYKKEAADAENAALKSYAAQTLPTLEKHLSGAKDLEKQKPAAGK